MTDSRVLLDSTIWLAYFRGENEAIESFIQLNDAIFLTSMLSVYEVYKGLKKMGLPARKTRRLMEFMRKTSLIMSVNYDACLEAVEITLEKKLHTVDSLIYAAALEAGASLLTLDNDFRNLKNAIVLAAPK